MTKPETHSSVDKNNSAFTNVEHSSAIRGDNAAAAAPIPFNSSNATKSARRIRWTWNGKILLLTGAVAVAVLVMAVGSYYYHSATTATTFLELSRTAEQKQDFEDQAKWLRRYALLEPDDVGAIYDMALASDKAADTADRDTRGQRVDAARRTLNQGIGQIGSKDPDKVSDLRVRLINRLVQLGGPWNREAERQIEVLNAAPTDPQATTSLALALAGEISDGSYSLRDPQAVAKVDNYWRWLGNQPATFVVGSALQQNPQNLDLITHFLFSRNEKAESFRGSQGGASLPETEIAEIADQAAKTLRDTPTSHAQLVLYRYLLLQGETDEANQVIRDAAIAAQLRLESLSKADAPKDAEQVAASDPSPVQNTSLITANPMPVSYWDFLAVYDAARLDQESDPEKTLAHLQFLASLDVTSVPKKLLESLYFEYGKLLVNADRADEALVVWKDAAKKIGASSILLPRAVAAVYASQSNWQAAEIATQQLAEAIDAAEAQLARVTDAELARSERIVQGRQLAAARWQLAVLKSYLAAGRGDEIAAINLLRSVVDSDADITPKDRGDALANLARYYANQGTWDAAATTLEKAVVLDPENPQLRQLASDAWNRSGNQVNSLRQLDLVTSEPSLLSTISELESRFAFQAQLQPQQQNFSQVRDAAALLKQQLQQRLDTPGDTPEKDLVALRSSLHYLEAFEFAIPPDDVAAESHLHSATLAQRIDEFAKKYPEEANLQALAAEYLASAKLDGDAMAALDRLTKPGVTGGVYEPLVRARVLSSLGRNADAAKLLIDTVKTRGQSELTTVPELSDKSMLQDAAVFASRGQDNDLAYQALSAIPEKDRNLQTLTAMTQLAGSIPAQSKSLTLDGKAVSAEVLYNHWFNVLKDREGDSGTYWRYLRADQLLNELRQRPQGVESDDPKLVETKKLSEAILTLRPRWGDALALQGRISALTGDPNTAVAQLRRAIAAGSTGLQTRQLLWQQLIALGRGDEAEQEIQMAEMNASGQSDRFSATLIDLALKQGDYTKSMNVAKKSAAEHPDDANAQLVIAATGTTAMANLTDTSRRDELIKEIEAAIARAVELTSADDARVIAANLRLAFTLDDDAKIDALIEELKAGKLPEPAQNQLLSQAYIAKKDYEQALTLLLRADGLEPTSTSQLRLAEIYRQLSRPQDEISALRKALQRDRTNDRLRNLLAQKLVARSADGQPVDWQAIGDLLAGSGGGATSNQLMHAILLGSEAVRELGVDADSEAARVRLNQSKTILRGIVKKRTGDWRTTTRYLASLLQQEPNVLKNLSQSEKTQINSEIRALFQTLIDIGSVEASDVYQYASYLLNQQEPDDDATIKNLNNKLNTLAANSLQALEVAVRFAERKGKRDETPNLVKDWANTALAKSTSTNTTEQNTQAATRELMVMAAAGSSLQRLGFTEDSLQWFERAYQEHPTQALGPYIVALGQLKKLDEAASVCAKHYAEHNDAQSATLLVEVLLNFQDNIQQSDRVRTYDEALSDASKRFQENAGFLEGLGTLKMAEGKYEDAIKCFVSALKVSPESIRSMNNLAMSYAEIPERASEGLGPINSALRLTNQNPELLDTKGVVLMAAGRLVEAEATFAEAFAASSEPRHLFHVILSQINQDKEAQAAKNWKELELDKLDPTGLTASERETLKKLKAKFASAS